MPKIYYFRYGDAMLGLSGQPFQCVSNSKILSCALLRPPTSRNLACLLPDAGVDNDCSTVKDSAIERWENEGGDIPLDVPSWTL